ncbi:glycosyl transferase [Mucilaginibacter mallensis]|uniref:glycosyl transferase n=1 Tax=Mucilaginibacter mallensis TaxID=652787 RepID=UPI0012F799EA|nr:glycosyl transferase [Mucilaginibacter mallensis]
MQRLINFLYRTPKSKLKTYKRFGGYYNYQKVINGNKQMKRAAYKLPISPSYADGLPVYFLTGKKYIHQTLFCISSLLKVSTERFHFVLIDDGTFTPAIADLISTKLPGATIVTNDQINTNLEKHLPADKYPVLHHKRSVYPHIKKMLDVHTAGISDWKLVLDSDMLFWKEPKAMINWLKNPDSPLHMVDTVNSYGYSPALMHELCGSEIPKLINVGAIGLNTTTLNWDAIEFWVKTLEEKEGTSYYLEQALSAMLIGQTPSVVLDKDDYKVNPSAADLQQTANTLHHYVDLSKEIYLKNAWKLIHE